MSNERILISGGGGREHALGYRFCESENVSALLFSPGNAGTQSIGKNLQIDFSDPTDLLRQIEKERIDRVVIGPEAHLQLGVANICSREGIPVFGPTKEAARLETDKAWATQFMERNNIPHPETFIPHDYRAAIDMVLRRNPKEVVIKATGLAQGKGVLLPDTKQEAIQFINRVYTENLFGEEQQVIIQKRLDGREISFLVFSDGVHVVPLLPVKDYKRIGDNDTGPNTGGMGSFAPRQMSESLWKETMDSIIYPTIDGMRKEGYPYKGILYAGLMLSGDGIKVIEFNARFGDPETQALMMLLESDLVKVMQSIDDESLSDDLIRFSEASSCCVVLATPGYPENPVTGQRVRGIESVDDKNVKVFHAGTVKKGKFIFTNGGRALGVTGIGPTQAEARERTYKQLEKIHFDGMQYRTDIAL